MKFERSNREEVRELEVLRIVNKEKIEDLNKDDLQTIINHDIFPVMSSSEKYKILEDTVVFSLRGDFNLSTVVGFTPDDDTFPEKGPKLLDVLDEKYKTKFYIERR